MSADGNKVSVPKGKLKNVKLADVIVDKRFREDLGDIEELAESIKEKGILQPVTLDSSLHLLAGGRRYAACSSLGLLEIPALVREIDGEIDAREIELIENIHRKNFTWQEESALIAEIDRLYKEKDTNWSGRKTAQLLDKSVAGVSRNLQLARAAEVIPEIKECKTADDALKMLKNLEERAIVQELRSRQNDIVETHNAGAIHSRGKVLTVDQGVANALRVADQAYIIKDVFDGLAGLRTNGNIQFIECDPPYGVSLNENKKGEDTGAATYNEVKEKDYPAFLDKLTTELYRVAGKDCWMVFWYGQSWHTEVLVSLRKAGWEVDDIPAVWVKPNGQTMQPDLYLGRSWEPFFCCRKGKPLLGMRGVLNSFCFPGCSGADRKYHPTQRPQELLKKIIATFTLGQTNVLVPFVGSGATLRACYYFGYFCFGFDNNGEYKDKFMLAVEEDTRRMFAQNANSTDE
jgi:ParB-like partition proteins